MGRRPRFNVLYLVPLLAALPACVTGGLSGGASQQGPGPGSAGSTGSAGSSNSDSGAGPGSAGQGVSSSPLLPARIRRLTNAEYENSVHAVLGNPSEPVASDFTPDARQSGFTVNDAQRVDSVLVKQIASAATKMAAEVRTKLDTFAPCSDPTGQAETCAKSFIDSFATRAYRRPLASAESQKLLELYHVGADGATYADGVELVVTGVLQSAAFLYLTETGNAATTDPVKLTPYETASALSYLVTEGPPDAELLSAAANDQLASPEQRSAQFSRLLSGATNASSRARVVRVIKEWIGIDRLPDTAKDSGVYPDFVNLKPAMVNETADFVQRLLDNESGTVGELLGANWTVTKDQNLIGKYGAGAPDASGKVSLAERRGILNQGAFLSVFAHASETGPVLRGVAVERRIACIPVPSPASLNLTVPPLVPDPSKTTRERLSAHATDPVCAGCHNAIDSFGFTFELYDGMGLKQTEAPNHKAIDSHTTIAVGKEFDGDYADSNALATALASSASVRECFARNVFRASSGRSDDNVQMSEQAFIDYWKTVPAPPPDATHPSPASAAQGSILEAMRAYVTNPNFTVRRAK